MLAYVLFLNFIGLRLDYNNLDRHRNSAFVQELLDKDRRFSANTEGRHFGNGYEVLMTRLLQSSLSGKESRARGKQ